MFSHFATNEISGKPALRARVLVCMLIASMAMICRVDAVESSDSGLPKAMQGVGIEQRLGDMIPEHLVFKNAAGESTSIGRLLKQGKPVLLSLNYSNCPGLCVSQLNGLVQGLNQMPSPSLGRDFLMVSISIDPSETSEKAMGTQRKYSQDLFEQHDAKGWEFWVGTAESIRQLTQAVGFQYTYDAKHKQYNHPSAAIFISPNGKITRYVFEIGFMPKTLKMAFVEAGEGRIGTPLDMIALWCVHYDPDENKYTASARRLMSLGAGVFVVAVLLITVPYWIFYSNARSPIQPDSISQVDPRDQT
jgi:protein SCO1/2